MPSFRIYLEKMYLEDLMYLGKNVYYEYEQGRI